MEVLMTKLIKRISALLISLIFLLERIIQIVSWFVVYFIANPIVIISSVFLLIIFFNFKNILNNFKYLYFFFIRFHTISPLSRSSIASLSSLAVFLGSVWWIPIPPAAFHSFTFLI